MMMDILDRTMTTKSTSHNRLTSQQWIVLSEKIVNKLEDFLNYFNIDYKSTYRSYYFPCPIHYGDNNAAANIFKNTGYWVCNTRQCEQYFKNNIIGFIRGVLSQQKFQWNGPGDQAVSLKETVDFILSFLNENITEWKTEKSLFNKRHFIQSTLQQNNNNHTTLSKYTKTDLYRALNIPSEYYIKRGYSTDILKKYDIGICTNPEKYMFQRSVVPIYDENNKYIIGCTGRSIFEKCPMCKQYHNPQTDCIKCAKWLHSKSFPKGSYLYNYYYAKKYIKKSMTAIIVEGPGDVWRLEEADIHNSVAILGTSITEQQQILLDILGVMNVILLLDNDNAGDIAKDKFKEKYSRLYNLYFPLFGNKNDIGDMTIDEINTTLKPTIKDLI